MTLDRPRDWRCSIDREIDRQPERVLIEKSIPALKSCTEAVRKVMHRFTDCWRSHKSHSAHGSATMWGQTGNNLVRLRSHLSVLSVVGRLG
jgi:hypothetical protein